MSKKIVAMLMAVAMAFSLLPVTALATDGPQEGNSQTVTKSDKNLTMNKTVTPKGDGTYTVSLESYATGSVTNTQAPVPMDFVLVLDVSGSMTEKIASYTYRATSKTSWSVSDVYNDYYDWGGLHRTDVTYYAKIDDEYYPVSYRESGKLGSKSYWLEANNTVLGKKVTKSTWENTVYDQALYTRKVEKLEAMKTAVNHFIDSVAAQKNGNTPVAHRISIVKFSGEGEIVKGLTDVSDSASLKEAVNSLSASGATAADYGMQKAKDVLTKRENKKNPSIVIMFTDGEPNHENGYWPSVAGNTVDIAKTLKAAGTKVYTIGMFEDANPSDTKENFNKYMNGVSSNYPEAVKAYNNTSGVTLGKRANGNYYFKADNAGDLDQVFQKISQSTTTTSTLDASAVVVDNVPSNFSLTEGSVKVYTANCIAKNGEEFTWDKATQVQTITPNSTKNDDGSQTISTTGFDFSKNWCGLDEKNQARGQKLIIEFTIKCTNYGGTQRTNAGAYIKANAGSTEQIISVDDPEVPVTVQLPNVNNPAAQTKVYKGAGYDITNEISEIIAGLVPVDGIKNQFIDLTYEIKDSSGNTVGTYTILAGQDTGTWSDTSTNITTGPNVGNYTYTITVTGQDKKQSNNKDSKECTATFTITPRDVTFKGQTDTKVWSGQEQKINTITQEGLLTGHTYEGLTYAATGTNTGTYDGKFTGSAIIKDADGTNVTANYNVKTEPGTLTITNSTSKVTVTFHIVGGKWNGDNPTAEDKTVQVTLTNGKGSLAGVTIPTGSPSDGHTGPGVWTNDAGINGNPVNATEITKNTVFTLTYSEIKPEITNVDVTFKIVGGTWNGDNPTAEDKTVQVTLTNGKGSLADVTIPTGVADADHQGDGTWSPATPEAGTVITQDGNKVFTLTFQEKEEQKPSDPVEWDVSRSKTATKLDTRTWTSNVTLSLPSAEEQLASDVVFVLDKSTSAELEQQALTMLANLKAQAESTKAKVKVGVVIFNKEANVTPLTDLTSTSGYNTIETAIKQTLSSGTNTHAGLLAGKKMLDDDNEVSANRKYLIFVSDGISYMYDSDGKVVPYYWISDNSPYTSYDPYSWSFKYRNNTPPANWSAWVTQIGDIIKTENVTPILYANHKAALDNKTLDISQYTNVTELDTDQYTTCVDRALYYTYQTYTAAKNEGYNCYAVVNNSPAASTYSWGPAFMNYLAGGEGETVSFGTIQNDILYAVGAGSVVEDKMGADFDFVPGSLKLTVDGKPLDFRVDGNTTYFGAKKATQEIGNNNYRFKVEYDSAEDKFTWTINESVSNFAPVQLTYTVKLTAPETKPGTYGTEDLKGEKNVPADKALFTNESAVLNAKNSAGAPLKPLDFPKPSVFYEVKSSGGSHSGGSRPSLNTKDHYGYIIGYPVDYYTGQPTTDQTKKPVRPEGKITRAEVATIYFRMLTDESRTKFWSQSNSYSDVKTGDWFNNAVSTLSNAGIIAGYEDGSFRPNGYITRAEFATIAARFFDVTYNGKDLFPDISGHWAKDYINQAANKGFVNGYEDGTFKPDRNITRAEAVTLVNRTLDRHPDKNHFTKDMLVWPDNMDQTKWYYADMQEATNSHTYQMKENSDKTKYENWTKTLPIRNWEALEKAWSNANSSQGNGNVV